MMNLIDRLERFDPDQGTLCGSPLECEAAQRLRELEAEIERLRLALYRIAWPENNNSRNAENKLARDALATISPTETDDRCEKHHVDKSIYNDNLCPFCDPRGPGD
jgi:hypothetical protein